MEFDVEVFSRSDLYTFSVFETPAMSIDRRRSSQATALITADLDSLLYAHRYPVLEINEFWARLHTQLYATGEADDTQTQRRAEMTPSIDATLLCTSTHIQHMSENIPISDEVYRKLKREKGDRSFSEVIQERLNDGGSPT